MLRLRTMAVTDRSRLRAATGRDDEAALVAYAGALAAAGVDAVQVRERQSDDGDLLRVVRAIVAAAHGTGCRVIVNERAHVAWAAMAHGVHLRGDGMPVRRLRAVTSSPTVIGRSTHGADRPEDVADADYAVFGTVYASDSKGAAAPVAGIEALQAFAAACPVPVLAIGGVTLAHVDAVRRAGASGVAAIDVFVQAYAAGGDRLVATVREMHAMFSDGEHTA
ncbi:MAG TPA: thiamine phosphate synthase [Luteitalea sp.]|nr:thiamine phosphate synthase [Luteitalea sp.]